MDKTKIHYNKSFIRTKIINGHPYLYEITPYWDPVAKKQHQKSKYIGKAEETVSKEKLSMIQDKKQIKAILETKQVTGALILLLLQPLDPEGLLLLLQKQNLLNKCLLLMSKK